MQHIDQVDDPLGYPEVVSVRVDQGKVHCTVRLHRPCTPATKLVVFWGPQDCLTHEKKWKYRTDVAFAPAETPVKLPAKTSAKTPAKTDLASSQSSQPISALQVVCSFDAPLELELERGAVYFLRVRLADDRVQLFSRTSTPFQHAP
jgi:hypothetical protein